jgi:hypothetical protein
MHFFRGFSNRANREPGRTLDLISLVGGVESSDQVSGVWEYYFRTRQLIVGLFSNTSRQCVALIMVNAVMQWCTISAANTTVVLWSVLLQLISLAVRLGVAV